MILHLEDWKKYPGAVVDTTTKNRSFVELADKYRAMGIKNYFFPLALTQPELQGVDPYDPHLSPDIQVKITLECVCNPWYYFREVFRLPAQGSTVPVPLRANRGNIGTYWLYFNHVDVALVQPRQTGKSVGADGVSGYVVNVAGRRATFSLITKDHDLRCKNVQRLKDMRDLLPVYLNPYNKKYDSNNQMGFTATLHENKYNTGVAQNAEAAAINLGRGSTSESNQVDEVPFCNLIHVTMAAFLASGGAARENAKKAGSFYGNIFTTTAGKLDTKEGKYTYEMFTGGMDFDERMLFDAGNNTALHRVVETQSQGDKPLVYICLSHKQLGYTDEWLYKVMTQANARGDEADRDFFNRWTTGSLRSPLSIPVMTAIKASSVDAEHIEITDRMYCIQWHIPEPQIASRLASGKFVLGNDTSEGVGKDAITLYLTDAETLDTIFSVAISETNIYKFIDWFAALMIKYPNIIAIPERKSQGVALIDTLIVKLIANNINPFKRIYNIIVEDGLIDTDNEFEFVKRDPISWPSWVADKYKSKFGYGTAGGGRHSRDNLYLSTLTRATKLSANKIKDKVLVRELCELVEKNGRIDHPAKGHDDMVIAYLLTNWFLLHSKNLGYYGIHNPAGRARAFDEVEAESKMTNIERLRAEQQKRFSFEIKRLTEQLESTNDQYHAQALEMRVRMISKRLNITDIDSNTIDDLIKSAKEKRSNRIQEIRYDMAG